MQQTQQDGIDMIESLLTEKEETDLSWLEICLVSSPLMLLGMLIMSPLSHTT